MHALSGVNRSHVASRFDFESGCLTVIAWSAFARRVRLVHANSTLELQAGTLKHATAAAP